MTDPLSKTGDQRLTDLEKLTSQLHRLIRTAQAESIVADNRLQNQLLELKGRVTELTMSGSVPANSFHQVATVEQVQRIADVLGEHTNHVDAAQALVDAGWINLSEV